MTKPINLICAIGILVAVGFSPGVSTVERQSRKTEKIALCQLKTDPAKYNHKLIEVTGFISHGFEDFTISEPDCPTWPGVWLEYGGTRVSGTLYCCGVTATRTRRTPLRVEEILIPLVDDDLFRRLDKLVQRKPDSVVHATIVGRFFAGRQTKYPLGTSWGGYGHMGCCSLLVIQQVISVDPQYRDDLDYGASVDQPEINEVGCGYRYLTEPRPDKESIEFQRRAESGEREWSFDNPLRVATEGLARLLKIDEKSMAGIKEVRRAQGRIVYQWHPNPKGASYTIVVNRPYILSFYAKDAKRVAWIVAAAYELSCS
jgi:hypothetical protein